jgi:hypothetical protein
MALGDITVGSRPSWIEPFRGVGQKNPRLGHAGILVADICGEEFQEPPACLLAGGRDDRWQPLQSHGCELSWCDLDDA